MEENTVEAILERLIQRVEKIADSDDEVVEELNTLQESMIMLNKHCRDWYTTPFDDYLK